MSKTTRTAETRARAVWRIHLCSAFRTALACIIVACTTLYGPSSLTNQLAFPAFSYVTSILIVSDATLGDTIRGCWHALYATVQVVPTSILTLWLVGPTRFSASGAALAVAVSAFLVALPTSTDLVSKRIAFGQLVIVYVGAVIHGEETEAVMHPVHVASNTALGALASVVALLLPYPWLAYCEVRKLCRLYAENASARMSLFVKAISALDNPTALEKMSQGKPLAETGSKLLENIKLIQEAVPWERTLIRPHFTSTGDKMEEIELWIRGMEIALTTCPSFPISFMNDELREVLARREVQLGLKLEQAKCFLPFDATTAPETKDEYLDMSLQSINTIIPTDENLPAYFFFFCVMLLQDDSTFTQTPKCLFDTSCKNNTEESREPQKQSKSNLKRITNGWNLTPRNETLVFAFKCSISLGLAVFFGLIFDKENGYWSGLTIAISFATGRQPTFTVANARAQGTAMGSVYGVLGCFLFQKYAEIRFLVLLPWIVFTSFLRHSRMYGQAGGISAVIGALLILGRKYYGPPNDFAIARLTEAFIGLSCFILIELLLQPMRAATLAKNQLSLSLGTLKDCIQYMVPYSSQEKRSASNSPGLKEKHRILKSQVNCLQKFMEDAELEPDFWFLPFRSSCYNKLQGYLSNMVDLLQFMAYNMEFLLRELQRCGVTWRELQKDVHNDLELFKENISSSLRCLEKITLIKSLVVFQKELQEDKTFHDLESGKSPNEKRLSSWTKGDDEAEKILSSYLQHSEEVIIKIHADEGEEELKGRMVLCLGAFGFCMSGLMRETKAIEKEIRELVQWESPSSLVNFSEILCKIDTL